MTDAMKVGWSLIKNDEDFMRDVIDGDVEFQGPWQKLGSRV